jgi:transposase-like protein
MGNRKQYTDEFKKDAVRLMLARGSRTVAEVADGLGLSQSMPYRWHERSGSELKGGAAGEGRAEAAHCAASAAETGESYRLQGARKPMSRPILGYLIEVTRTQSR